ncbi:hypothetical protein SAMN05192529_13920 [Arachidicoccus rhizosphaerae]|jgi:hypothetical protein|uniref:Polyketide cyclase / dehydrase and lipid transport n=1 Tax=Arachidicoccus rhizosphaerae TaxID=551991 RepID=A0A1H4CYH4_9BACT|nr:hypothetical protein [Arachidicoccus rhizosphaerae]SEA65348.1 hypothetical protein SAMN05192529_13920 [Arachidicoccus rhizosphaerae]
MKYLKLAVFSIGSLFLLITGIGLLFPSQVTVIRSASFNQPVDSVYAMLHDIQHWKQWLFDSTHPVRRLTANSAGPGAAVQVGNSKITITHDSAYYIESTWQGGRSNDQICGWQLSQDKNTPGTLVRWHYTQHLDWYPWERVGAILNEKILGPSMDSSFAHLKRYFDAQ